MTNTEQKHFEPKDTIMLGMFGYVPFLKKDSREKIIKALDDVMQNEERLRPI